MARKIYFFLISLFILSACSQKPADKTAYTAYSGILVVVGNEPFTSFALDDGEGHITILQTDKSFEKKLNKLQGKKVRVYGVPLPEDELIQLKSIEPYNKKAE